MLENNDMCKINHTRMYIHIFFCLFQEPPFVYASYNNDTGASILTGFIPDLVSRLALHMGRSYRLQLVSYGGYGVRRHDESWSGMIGEVIRQVKLFKRGRVVLSIAKNYRFV